MRRFIIHIGILLTVFLLTSCRPKGVLSTQEMTDLLYDIHLVESLTNTTYGEAPSDWMQELSNEDFTDLAYQSVLNKHGVSEAVFYQSVAYYSKKMRLYTRIYVDVDKKLATYVQSIDTWTATKKTERAVNERMIKDDARIRALFDYLRIKPDTTSRIAFSYRPDSVKAINIRYINRLLKRSANTPPVYSMIGLKNLSEMLISTVVDSTGLTVEDSIKKDDIPTVDVLLKKALPMEELLRLRDAGAYDALMPEQSKQQ